MRRKLKDLLIYLLLVYHRTTLVNMTRLAQKGERRKIRGNAIVMDQARRTITSFATSGDEKDEKQAHMTIEAFDGLLQAPPLEINPAFKAWYDKHLRLTSREDGDGM